MTFKITITKTRFQALLKEGVSCGVLWEKGQTVHAEVYLMSELDVLRVFYAGAEYGAENMVKYGKVYQEPKQQP